MSVYTPLSSDFFDNLVKNYDIGSLSEASPIKGGVTNTLYHLQTSAGEYVFTLFEALKAEALQSYVDLMQHLSQRKIPCTTPLADRDGQIIHQHEAKPYVLAPYLPGSVVEQPTVEMVRQLGELLASIHLAGLDFPQTMRNQRDLQWCMQTYDRIKSKLEGAQQRIIEAEIKRHARINYKHLPQGIIHADIFRDNVIFEGDKLSGCIDFYYACTGTLIYDLAIAVNDWCLPQRAQAQVLVNALMAGYNAVRPLDIAEKKLFKEVLCLASLRFWLSRLQDSIEHDESDTLQVKDPREYEILLNLHRS